MVKKKKVRSIRVGIRFKFSVIMILGIVMASSLIGLAVYNQHENKIKDTILRLSGTIMKGASEDAETYLRQKHFLQSPDAGKLSARQKKMIADDMDKARSNMEQYFSSIIKKDEILDIAYMVDVEWKDISAEWNRRDQARYSYFSRDTGRLFELDLFTRLGQVIQGGRGRDDAQLKPTILSHFMQNVNTGSYLAFTEGRKDEKKDFVIVGMPIFNGKNDARLYDGYIDFKKSQFRTVDQIKKYKESKEKYRTFFINRIIAGRMNLEYNLNLDSENKKKTVLYFYYKYLDLSGLNRARRTGFARDLSDMVGESIEDGRLPLFRVKVILNSIMKEYRVTIRNSDRDTQLWQNFYYFIKRNGIDVDTPMTLDELALVSFRKDLAGIIGIFLLRDAFYSEMKENRTELLNLILSILIRAIVVALFFPTFIIRSITAVEEGAFEIGRGNLDKRIEIKGSDELGRLSDIINIMTANLKKAQDEKLDKQRMEEELKTARQIQSALLPEKLPRIKGLDFGAYYEAQTESGGDYYDFIELENNRLAVIIADVSGHGVGSGLVMAMTRTLIHTYCDKVEDPKKILELINTYLYENTGKNYFVTMFYGILDLNRLTMKFSSAGHNTGIIMRGSKILETPAGGIALGATETGTMLKFTSVREMSLARGDYFIQYTDGVEEAIDADRNEFGMDRFLKALLAGAGKHPKQLIDTVVKSIEEFTGKVPQHDDITLFAIKIKE